MTEFALHFIGFSVIIVLLVMISLRVGRRSTKNLEDRALAEKADNVHKQYADCMLDCSFLWTICQGRSELVEMKQLERDEFDVITTVHCPNYLLADAKLGWFDFNNRQYSNKKVSPFSVRMKYCAQDDSQILYCSEHLRSKLFIYRRDTGQLVCIVHIGWAWNKFHRIFAWR